MSKRSFEEFLQLRSLAGCCICCAASAFGAVTPVAQTYDQAVDKAWNRVLTGLWDPGTGCIYDYISSNRFGEVSYKACLPTPEEMALQFPNPNGWRVGFEDGDLRGGPMLVAALKRLEAHGGRDDEARAAVEKVYRGLRNCATISGIPGFVARGVSPIDGKSFYSNSSRDQYTLFIYAMWRYYRSGFASVDWSRFCVSSMCELLQAHWELEARVRSRAPLTPHRPAIFRVGK